MYYRVSKNGKTISRHDTFKEAKRALRELPVSKFDDGYLDEVFIPDEKEYQLCHKQGRKIYQDRDPLPTNYNEQEWEHNLCR